MSNSSDQCCCTVFRLCIRQQWHLLSYNLQLGETQLDKWRGIQASLRTRMSLCTKVYLPKYASCNCWCLQLVKVNNGKPHMSPANMHLKLTWAWYFDDFTDTFWLCNDVQLGLICLDKILHVYFQNACFVADITETCVDNDSLLAPCWPPVGPQGL